MVPFRWLFDQPLFTSEWVLCIVQTWKPTPPPVVVFFLTYHGVFSSWLLIDLCLCLNRCFVWSKLGDRPVLCSVASTVIVGCLISLNQLTPNSSNDWWMMLAACQELGKNTWSKSKICLICLIAMFLSFSTIEFYNIWFRPRM